MLDFACGSYCAHANLINRRVCLSTFYFKSFLIVSPCLIVPRLALSASGSTFRSSGMPLQNIDVITFIKYPLDHAHMRITILICSTGYIIRVIYNSIVPCHILVRTRFDIRRRPTIPEITTSRVAIVPAV